MPVKPALTPEEWAMFQTGKGYVDSYILDDNSLFPIGLAPRRHALAAVALHGQSFGFTLFDVQMLREEVRLNRENRQRITAGYIDDLADRIAALLPPEDK